MTEMTALPPRLLLLLLLALVQSTTAAADRHDPDASLKAIVAKMTPQEKAAQLDTAEGSQFVTDGHFDVRKSNKTLAGLGFGRLHDVYAVDPNVANDIQRAVMASSRFGIGAIFGEECTHGYQKDGHTIFPAPLSSAATFNESLLYDIGRATGSEARVHGTHECWGPILGLAREPRWGRSNEEFGEDTFLAKTLGVQVTLGLQDSGNLTSDQAVAALLKHYVLYSVPENGLNTAPAQLGRRAALSDYVPTFCAAIKEGGASGVMSSYNTVDGEAVTASPFFLTEVLRKQCGFDGLVVADFGAIGRLFNTLHVAGSACDAVQQYLAAGGNMRGSDIPIQDCVVGFYGRKDPALAALLDSRVLDVLRVKARLGLVPDPAKGRPTGKLVDPTLMAKVNDSPEHRATATLAAHEAQILLNNTGGSRLPWDLGALKSIAVIGPNSDQPRYGDYTGAERHRGGNTNMINCKGVLEATKALLVSSSTKLTHVLGTSVSGDGPYCGGGQGYYQPVWRHHYSPTTATTTTTATATATTSASSGDVATTGDAPATAAAAAAADADDDTATSPGIMAKYWLNQDMQGPPALTRLDSGISFHWFNWGPAPEVPSTLFSASWTGFITSDATVASGGGGFQLWIDRCTAGARLWIDGNLVVDRWDKYDAKGSWNVPYNFTAGKPVAVRLDFRKTADQSNGAELELRWDQVGATGLADAEAAAQSSDATILVVGGSDQTSNEGVDRSSLALPGDQLALVQRVSAAAREGGKKLAVVVVDTKPLAEPWIRDNVGVLLESFAAGQAQGTATMNVISGAYNPAGRLPISFPQSAARLPAYYAFHSGARTNNYCDGDAKPLWAFGHGLSFTSFSYANLTVSSATVPADGHVQVSFSVKNTGGRAGDEVPQLYIKDAVSSTTTPTILLKGFTRVHIAAGGTERVTFSVDVAEELTVVGHDYTQRVEPGLFHVYVGPASDNLPLTGQFHVG